MTPTKLHRQKAGHYEILGETLAKFEFFEAGWNPYQRYLDVDKVDFILRRLDEAGGVIYREIQVKYGKLYDCIQKWETPIFDVSSWRFFRDGEFSALTNRNDFFLVYVLSRDAGYEKDIFIFPIAYFQQLLDRAPKSGEKRQVWISRSKADNGRWYFRLKSRFEEISDSTCIDVSSFRRNFDLLKLSSLRSGRFSWEIDDVIFTRANRPNKAPEPTTTAVTPRAT